MLTFFRVLFHIQFAKTVKMCPSNWVILLHLMKLQNIFIFHNTKEFTNPFKTFILYAFLRTNGCMRMEREVILMSTPNFWSKNLFDWLWILSRTCKVWKLPFETKTLSLCRLFVDSSIFLTRMSHFSRFITIEWPIRVKFSIQHEKLKSLKKKSV